MYHCSIVIKEINIKAVNIQKMLFALLTTTIKNNNMILTLTVTISDINRLLTNPGCRE